MVLIYSIVVGVLFGTAFYLLLRRNIVKLVFGLVVLSQATNLFILFINHNTHRVPPILTAGEKMITQNLADPLPQALILTAIVIGFGVQAFALVLILKAKKNIGTDIRLMGNTDR